jgi:lambda family phage portal protein
MANWIDRTIGAVAPGWQLRRQRARLASDLLQRHYEGAATGRRTQGWRRPTTDANAAVGPNLAKLRETARDLVRNNPYAASALDTIVNHTVGDGIVATVAPRWWQAWADTTAIDADGRLDLSGLEKLVLRTVAESGEVLVRRRWRRMEDGLPVPLQLQVLEADYIDMSRDGTLPGGNKVIHGVEFDALGRRVAYWLYREHPGAIGIHMRSTYTSVRVPASEITHVFRPDRPGQVRGPSWFAPVLLRFKDFDEFEDATLMKQKIAACLAVLTTDPNGQALGVGGVGDTSTAPETDSLEPGMITNLAPGRDIHVVQPPSVNDYPEYSKVSLRAIATGIGVSYEDMTGDYTNLPFSAARMSRLRHWSRVEDWRWRLVVPQFLQPVWAWAGEAALSAGLEPLPVQSNWTAPALPMLDPDKEGLAFARNIRSGASNLFEAIRERGYDPKRFLEEYRDANELLDALGLKLDSDPRYLSQQGQLHPAPKAASDSPRDDADNDTGEE